MCGISGLLGPAAPSDALHDVVERMTCCLVTRGPDDSGRWVDPDAGVALGHRRLSILDLSEAGHQPMTSPSGRFVTVFNGELYNYAEVRAELGDGVPWRGHSDTEVLLAAVDRWGVEAAVRRFAGMFAIALWDRARRELHLIRDRLGEKPLYVGEAGASIVFGSELKALRAHPSWRGSIDRGALTLFFRHNYVPAPYSIYEGVRKVRPGTILTLRPGGRLEDAQERAYWRAADAVSAGAADPLDGSDAELVDGLERELLRTISEEMVADVPLGAFLSGGIDSSLIVALMQRASSRPVRTFTIAFDEPGYNEAMHARAVANHLGTDHAELTVTPTDALRLVPRLSSVYDEPFADASQIPTCLVAAMARRHVTVALSGDGGDELFGGYNRYTVADRLWRVMARVPAPARRGVAAGLRRVPPARWDRAYRRVAGILPGRARVTLPGDKLHKIADVLAKQSVDELYVGLVSQWHRPTELVVGGREPATPLTDPSGRPALPDMLSRWMYLDLVTYLPDDILTKVDRAGMAVSLETRAPFLDHRIVEFAWRLPRRVRVRDGEGKWLLRQLLYRHVPRALLDRPKMGFGVPIDAWLRGPLREWAAELLEPTRVRREGYLHADVVQRAWRDHQSGHRNLQYQLWGVLMFQAWLETQAA